MLHIFSPVPQFTEPLKPVKGVDQEPTELIVEVSDEKAPVKWLKAGEEIDEEDERYEFKVQGRRRSLVIKDTTLEDAAEYTCELPQAVKTSSEVTVEGRLLGIYFKNFIVGRVLLEISSLFPYSYVMC